MFSSRRTERGCLLGRLCAGRFLCRLLSRLLSRSRFLSRLLSRSRFLYRSGPCGDRFSGRSLLCGRGRRLWWRFVTAHTWRLSVDFRSQLHALAAPPRVSGYLVNRCGAIVFRAQKARARRSDQTMPAHRRGRPAAAWPRPLLQSARAAPSTRWGSRDDRQHRQPSVHRGAVTICSARQSNTRPQRRPSVSRKARCPPVCWSFRVVAAVAGPTALVVVAAAVAAGPTVQAAADRAGRPEGVAARKPRAGEPGVGAAEAGAAGATRPSQAAADSTRSSVAEGRPKGWAPGQRTGRRRRSGGRPPGGRPPPRRSLQRRGGGAPSRGAPAG